VRRTDQVTGFALLVFAVGYGAVAVRSYPYWSATGPGSGFFPVWLAAAMAVLAVLLIANATRAADPGGRWLPGGRGLVRLCVVIGATALLVAVMDYVGMVLGAALFLVGILRFLERYPWRWAVGIAAAVALANYAVFTYWLQVPFPKSPLGI
jgi:putative tricarboxylic transport membrane protein